MNHYANALDKAALALGKPIGNFHDLHSQALKLDSIHEELQSAAQEMARRFDAYSKALERREHSSPPTRYTTAMDIEAGHAKFDTQMQAFIAMLFMVGGQPLANEFRKACGE